MELVNAVQIMIETAEIAQKNGLFTLKGAVAASEAVDVLVGLVNNTKQPIPEEKQIPEKQLFPKKRPLRVKSKTEESDMQK